MFQMLHVYLMISDFCFANQTFKVVFFTVTVFILRNNLFSSVFFIITLKLTGENRYNQYDLLFPNYKH